MYGLCVYYMNVVVVENWANSLYVAATSGEDVWHRAEESF